MATKKFGVDFDAATTPLTGTEALSVVQGGVLKDCTVQDIADIAGVADGDKGDITVSGGGASWTIDANAVSNTKLADVPTATIKGRATAGAGDPEDLTSAQATALLDTFTSSLKGLAPASGGGTTNFLRADGTWTTPTSSGDSWTYIVLSADVSNNSLTPINVTDFVVSPVANKTVVIQGQFIARAAAATTGVQPGVTWPTGVDGVIQTLHAIGSGTALNQSGNNTGAFTSAATAAPAANTSWPISVFITMAGSGSVSGSLQFTLQSEIASSQVTIRAGSWIRYRTIN